MLETLLRDTAGEDLAAMGQDIAHLTVTWFGTAYGREAALALLNVAARMIRAEAEATHLEAAEAERAVGEAISALVAAVNRELFAIASQTAPEGAVAQ